MSKNFTILIDGESFEIPKKRMTANEILALGEISPNEHYLVEIKGKYQDSFEDKGDEEIHLHEGAKFISVFVGPTPVSDTQQDCGGAKLIGARLFAAQLRELNYDVIELQDNHVKFPYTVKVGKYAGMELELGFVVPADFPMTPPPGPHISELLHPNISGGNHPTGGIHPSPSHGKHFGSSWQYWSRPHKNWADGPRTAKRYMAFIAKLWASQ